MPKHVTVTSLSVKTEARRSQIGNNARYRKTAIEAGGGFVTYLITFLEGIITFVSPCLLPMIPIYVTYFAAGEEVRTSVVLRNALGFVLGFTCVFIAMGALASSVGAFFIEYQSAVNVVCGLVVIAFGLYFLGIIKINLFHGAKNPRRDDSWILLLGAVRRHLLHRMDAVRGGVPRLGRSCWPRSRHRWRRALSCFCATRPASVFRSWRLPCSSTS